MITYGDNMGRKQGMKTWSENMVQMERKHGATKWDDM
jgi:hypothetical protein